MKEQNLSVRLSPQQMAELFPDQDFALHWSRRNAWLAKFSDRFFDDDTQSQWGGSPEEALGSLAIAAIAALQRKIDAIDAEHANACSQLTQLRERMARIQRET